MNNHKLFETIAIGYYRSNLMNRKNAYDVGRQTTSSGGEGVIELVPGNNYEQALIGLSGTTRIWVLFQFHKNKNWKPMVLPPRGSEHKVGVFATRSPYRPNPIGLSSIELKDIEGLKIYLRKNDLLDGTPIIDIKPYLTYSDSFENCQLGWLDETLPFFEIKFSPLAQSQIDYLQNLPIQDFIFNQLQSEPINHRKKRLISTHSVDLFILCYRTWRIEFQIDLNKYYVTILRLFSGYTEEELNSLEDIYQDKILHRNFKKIFIS